MTTHQHLNVLNELKSQELQHTIQELEAHEQANRNDFQTKRTQVADCPDLGHTPWIHEPDDCKVERYSFASLCAIGSGWAVAIWLTQRAETLAVAENLGIVTPATPTWQIIAGVSGAFITASAIAEALFRAIPFPRFRTSVDRWFRNGVYVLIPSVLILVLARVASGPIVDLLGTLEPYAWVMLESSLLVLGSLGRIAARTFAWSRPFVAVDRGLREEIGAARLQLTRIPKREIPPDGTPLPVV